MTLPKPRHAYDLHIEPRPAERLGEDGDHGWVFGLPRGITSEQWPLDPVSGAPLMHGFTLLIPEDYRCHGPDVVAFAFFATAADQSDGGAEVDETFQAMILDPSAASDVPETWIAHHAQALSRPDRLHYVTDILNYHYAVLLMDAAQLAGDPCQPPDLLARDGTRPEWMGKGAAAAYVTMPFQIDEIGGEAPVEGLDWHRAVRRAVRERDPNAGREPVDDFDAPDSDYVQPFPEKNDFEPLPWVETLAANHMGGTMQQIQAVPAMGVYYVGFEESFGGYNFGTGNAQLDFHRMRFDWACG